MKQCITSLLLYSTCKFFVLQRGGKKRQIPITHQAIHMCHNLNSDDKTLIVKMMNRHTCRANNAQQWI